MFHFTRAELERFLTEDVPYHDLSTAAIGAQGTARIGYLYREHPVVCGTEEVRGLFDLVGVDTESTLRSGEPVLPGQELMQLSIATLGTYGLAAISGVFYPLAALPGWLQVIGQIFPMYWLGLGFRQVLLPAEAAMLEIGGTWRTVEMLIVLGIWTLIGLLGAPRALRRMIRGVSGSKIVEARERVLSRGY